LLLLLALAWWSEPAQIARAQAPLSPDDRTSFHALRVFSADPAERDRALSWLVEDSDAGAIPVLINLMRWMQDDRDAIARGLRRLTGEDAGERWFDWMLWQQKNPRFKPHAGFANFLAHGLAFIDPRFLRFVHGGVRHDIRLEEIAWGGVRVDGIPALDNPRMVAPAAAGYLNPDDPVFGVAINGEARAYPLRIANWHEMVNDTVGGVPVSLAYCTLCGAGILFDGRIAGWDRPTTFGSSGLLYRSNKLMYDRTTDSLWNHFTGKPVVGALVGSGIELSVLPLATTTWNAWLARHPETTVLSIDTGHARDYGAGVAYRDYFASPELMFPAAVRDERLHQKDIVFGVRAPGGVKAWPISAFADGRVINDRVGLTDLVLVGHGAERTVRAYESGGRKFSAGSDGGSLSAEDGAWRLTEDALIGPGGVSLPRLPGHLAYWFAWAGYFEDAALGEPAK
jgi:hypothetical protein